MVFTKITKKINGAVYFLSYAKLKIIKIFLSLSLFFLVYPSQAQDSKFEQFDPTQPFNLLTETRYPYQFFNEKVERIEGPTVNIVREMFLRADLDYRMEIGPWARFYEQALTEPNTCIFSTFVTPQHRILFNFVTPLYKSDWTFFADTDSDIKAKNLVDLIPYTVGVYRGDVRHEYLVAHQSVPLDLSVVATDELNARMLEAGRIDVWFTSKAASAYYAEKMGGQFKELFTDHEDDLGLACNKAVPETVIQTLQSTLDEMHKDRTIHQLSRF